MKGDCVGWDVGGAHLKAARLSAGALSAVVQVPCPLWRGVEALDAAWRRSEAALGAAPHAAHAVAMTGELADCFASRKEGVAKILTAVSRSLQRPFKVYAGSLNFLDAAAAVRCAEQTASANWHATAACLGKLLGAGVLVDIGSTTTDVVPFTSAGAAASACRDHERLRAGELVYTGVVRTPVMALADVVRCGGESLPVVAELFATTADVYRVLGRLAEDADQYPACDGAAKTPAASARRLARMFGCDAAAGDDWRAPARALADCQMRKIETAYRTVRRTGRVDAAAPVVGAGAGRFLARELAHRAGHVYIDFADLFDAAPAGGARLAGDCASAVSLAALMHRAR